MKNDNNNNLCSKVTKEIFINKAKKSNYHTLLFNAINDEYDSLKEKLKRDLNDDEIDNIRKSCKAKLDFEIISKAQEIYKTLKHFNVLEEFDLISILHKLTQ